MNTSIELSQMMSINGSEHCSHSTMSSREISRLTGKRHHNVIRDIRKVISNLAKVEDLSSDLSFNVEVVKSGIKGRPEEVYHLNRQLTLTLTTGYSDVQRYRVIRRMDDLEDKVKRQPFRDLMNERKRVKFKLLDKEKTLLSGCQMQLGFCEY